VRLKEEDEKWLWEEEEGDGRAVVLRS
jgi:hypothetical protein